jgi:hypothetical protein
MLFIQTYKIVTNVGTLEFAGAGCKCVIRHTGGGISGTYLFSYSLAASLMTWRHRSNSRGGFGVWGLSGECHPGQMTHLECRTCPEYRAGGVNHHARPITHRTSESQVGFEDLRGIAILDKRQMSNVGICSEYPAVDVTTMPAGGAPPPPALKSN